MNNKTLEQLDFFRIRDAIATHCMSEEGIECVKARIPFVDSKKIKTVKNQTEEWMRYISSGAPTAFHGWNTIQPFFSILGVDGSCLEIENLYALGTFCRSCSCIKKTLCNTTKNEKTKTPDTPHLLELISKIPDLTNAEQKIFRILTKDGELRDLPELQKIRSNIQKLRQNIDNLMHKYTTDVTTSKTLQSQLPALRANRQVLAVKANFKGRIKGIVHEMSQTGQTLYIEPEDVVQKNNELIQEEFKYTQEIRRILKELTAILAEDKESLNKAHTIMLELDVSYAAARWGVKNECIIAATIDSDKKAHLGLTLYEARHPLLGKTAVPITVQCRPHHRVLILTGPNTGGKTVTLKTIALFALLNQSGFPLPAKEGTMLPIFSSFFADIGDEQSLDQSLSTFSGHMKNIAKALDEADENSLILLDELGSGTDPQEGGGIAMAVLDELIQRNSFVLVTTHHGILKNFGYTHKTCVNASVDFDQTTLSPNYRILMGVPGESHALDIARRSGLPASIVSTAEQYITSGKTNVSELIKGLHAKHEELAHLEKEFKIKEKHIREKWQKVDLKDLQLKQKELALKT
ncbi:MAG TPA: endonuclease MutS2, partial [Treponemataceae bacterium]|nr:endonuclease MutS2 [Treponemataceae bacterium]